MLELDTLHNKLDVLLKKHATLQAENKSLKETIARQSETINGLNEKAGKLEEDAQAAGLGKAMDDTDKDAVKKQIDTLIGDIDKILTAIND